MKIEDMQLVRKRMQQTVAKEDCSETLFTLRELLKSSSYESLISVNNCNFIYKEIIPLLLVTKLQDDQLSNLLCVLILITQNSSYALKAVSPELKKHASEKLEEMGKSIKIIFGKITVVNALKNHLKEYSKKKESLHNMHIVKHLMIVMINLISLPESMFHSSPESNIHLLIVESGFAKVMLNTLGSAKDDAYQDTIIEWFHFILSSYHFNQNQQAEVIRREFRTAVKSIWTKRVLGKSQENKREFRVKRALRKWFYSIPVLFVSVLVFYAGYWVFGVSAKTTNPGTALVQSLYFACAAGLLHGVVSIIRALIETARICLTPNSTADKMLAVFC